MKKHAAIIGSIFLLAACTDAEPGEPATNALTGAPLAPPAPGEGIQLQMKTTVQPGQESYGCRLFQVPEGGLFVHDEAVQFGPGGHHVLWYRTPYQEIPSVDERGDAVDATEVHDCSKGATSRWKIDAVLGGSETLGGDGMLHGLPEGVAVPIPAGTVLVMSTHYLNAGATPIEVDSRVNLYTIPAEEVEVEAGLLYLDNHVLRVPPMGKASARMRCPVTSDISIVNLQSHMHGRGASFSASAGNGSGLVGEDAEQEIYSTSKWVEPPVKVFDPLLSLRAGQTIELRCDYASTESRGIVYGPTADDEMCQLIGPYFPRDENVESCKDAEGAPAARWIGEGEAAGSETLSCLRGAPPLAADQGYGYFGCVQAACPEIAEQVSEVVHCHDAARGGTCAAACEAVEGEACGPCLREACAKEEQGLGSSRCLSR